MFFSTAILAGDRSAKRKRKRDVVDSKLTEEETRYQKLIMEAVVSDSDDSDGELELDINRLTIWNKFDEDEGDSSYTESSDDGEEDDGDAEASEYDA